MSYQIREQIDLTMGFHPGNAEVAPLYENLRTQFMEVEHYVNDKCPDGRCKSLAITHLEEALMRSIQAIAVEQPLGAERVREA